MASPSARFVARRAGEAGEPFVIAKEPDHNGFGCGLTTEAISEIIMLSLLIQSFYLALPAYLANMAPVVFDRLNWLAFFARPIDAGRKWGSSYIFGSTKTWRGLVAAVMAGLLITGLQAGLYNLEFFQNISLFNYQNNFWLFGLLAGLGAILGDLFKSFFKRRLKIASGQPWPFFDQLDFIAGFFLFTWLLVRPPWPIVLTVVIMTLILHPLVNIIGYLLRFKKVWW